MSSEFAIYLLCKNSERSATFKSGSLELVDYYLTGTFPLELNVTISGVKYICFGSALFAL